MPNLLQTSFQTHYTLIIIFQGIVLVYDVTTEDSFKHIAQWLQNIQDVSAAVICLCSLQNTLYIYHQAITGKCKNPAVFKT